MTLAAETQAMDKGNVLLVEELHHEPEAVSRMLMSIRQSREDVESALRHRAPEAHVVEFPDHEVAPFPKLLFHALYGILWALQGLHSSVLQNR